MPLLCSVLEQLGGKQIVMQHLGHEDPNVRYEALLAVQKLMVHNWLVWYKWIVLSNHIHAYRTQVPLDNHTRIYTPDSQSIIQ